MKDYVTQIKEITPFIASLLADYNSEEPSGYVVLNDEGEPKLNFTKTGIVPTDGVTTVSICRLTQVEKDWFEAVSPHAKVLGEASVQYIQGIDDINWYGAGKGSYHKVHKQGAKPDGEGGTYTPPELHGVIAS